MKIRDEISKLNIKDSLFVVMGSHHGIIYKFANDEINTVEEVRIDTPVYSDNEGMFSGGGPNGKSFGSVLELKKGVAQENFSKSMGEKVSRHLKEEHLGSVYLYAPSEMKNLIDVKWNTLAKQSIKMRFDGNYTSKHPTALLEMVKKGNSK